MDLKDHLDFRDPQVHLVVPPDLRELEELKEPRDPLDRGLKEPKE